MSRLHVSRIFENEAILSVLAPRQRRFRQAKTMAFENSSQSGEYEIFENITERS